MPIPPKTPSRVFRTAPAKAALAVGGAALAAGALLAFPATASAASKPANLLIRPSRPFPSFSFPGQPTTQFPTSGGSTIIPVGVKKSAAPKHSEQAQFSYVSTFSPAPVATSAPANTASASCVASSAPAPGPGGDLDLPGINGASKDVGHVGALPINSLGPTAMLPPQIDSTNLGQLKVTRPVDATSTNLSMVASSGYRFPCVHIEVGPGRGFGNAEYALVNAGLVADDRSGSTETLTWTYSTILWSYTVPGSATVHQGSGQINAQPDRTATSLVTDSKAVAAGTIGLTLVVSLGLIALYVIGRRRNRARYRARYYRRAAARAQREIMAAGVMPIMQSAEQAQPSEIWEPRAGEVVEVAETAGAAVPEAEAAEAATAEAVEPEAAQESEDSEEVPEPEVAGQPESKAEPESESEQPAESAEPAEPVKVVESVEPEAVEREAEPEVEAESTESHIAESEPDSDEAEEPVESEAIVQSGGTTEPEDVVQSDETTPSEDVVQSDETTPSEDVVQSNETAESGDVVQSGETAESEKTEHQAAEPSESEAEPAPGDKHEPAAAR
ncbi:hypothetical protein [Actinocrinis sp.]|uniref:hypothetical protein n=1 Tax=Actinocrinis sp. TaxID=1920516 RepID=UPI002C55FF58|nr:hypothetical protein [Actinocrinis sp.]HXR70547.1 hypothetical protein [Actinocrinis sp.]